MKSQFSIDFYVAIIVFVLFSTYILFQVISFTPSYIREINNQRLKSEAFQISELLINDPGEPLNWEDLDENQIKRIGFSNHIVNYTNYLSLRKIQRIGICDEIKYEKVKKWLAIKESFSLLLKNLKSNEILISCFPAQKIPKELIVISRIVYLDSGDYGVLTLELW